MIAQWDRAGVASALTSALTALFIKIPPESVPLLDLTPAEIARVMVTQYLPAAKNLLEVINKKVDDNKLVALFFKTIVSNAAIFKVENPLY